MANIRKRGPYQWQVSVRRKGYPVQYRTFEIKADAETWARSIENEMDRGVFVCRAEAESTTLRECLERYLKEVSSLKNGGPQEVVKARNIFRHSIAELFMSNVRGSDVAQYRDHRLAHGKAASTVQKELALLSHLFNVARREWGMESLINPVQLVSKPRVQNQRDRRLISDEETSLLAAATPTFDNSNPWLEPMIILAIETAMRKGELLALRWDDIQLDRKILKSKNKDPKGKDLWRIIPLSPRALSILNELPKSMDGRVFPTTDNAIKLAFNRACKRAGIDDLRFHDLRHEATSRLFEKGLNPMQVATVTGHKTLQMLKRYTHLRVEEIAEILNRNSVS